MSCIYIYLYIYIFKAEEFYVTLRHYVELSQVYLLLEHRYPTEHAVTD